MVLLTLEEVVEGALPGRVLGRALAVHIMPALLVHVELGVEGGLELVFRPLSGLPPGEALKLTLQRPLVRALDRAQLFLDPLHAPLDLGLALLVDVQLLIGVLQEA